jgi:hypothetical protein
MTQHRHPPFLIAAGILFLALTLLLLFHHVRSISDLNLTHFWIVVSLTGALITGHASARTTFGYRFYAFIMFIVCTIVCVTFSAGRSAVLMEQYEREALKGSQEYAALIADIPRLQSLVDQAKAQADGAQRAFTAAAEAMAKECASGKGIRCDGKKEAATLAQSNATTLYTRYEEHKEALDHARAKLESLKPPAPANEEFQSFALPVAFLSGKPVSEVMDTVKFFAPYVLAFILEGMTIFCFNARYPVTPHSPPPSTVTVTYPPTERIDVAQLARELGKSQSALRKQLRATMPKPLHGSWSWSREEAERIKQQLASGIGSVH